VTPPPSSGAVEKTLEIQRLASLAKKLAARGRGRVFALSSVTLPPPRAVLSLSPLLVDESQRASDVLRSPSDVTTSRRLDSAAGYLSGQTVAEKEEENRGSALVTDVNGEGLVLCRSASATDDVSNESTRASALQRLRRGNVSSSGDCVWSQNDAKDDFVTPEKSRTTTGSGVKNYLQNIEEEENHSMQSDVNATVDNGDRAMQGSGSARNVSPADCSKLHVGQSTTLVSSTSVIKDSLEVCGGPLPVAARLIITSPVSSRACFVENPHRRSMCKPLTLTLARGVDDVQPARSAGDTTSHPVVTSLRRRGRELPVAAVSGRDAMDPTNYGRSWYDILHGDGNRCNGEHARCYVSAQPAVIGDYSSSDTRSISSQSSVVSSDKSSQLSSGLTSRRVNEASALSGDGPDERTAICRINAPNPALTNSNSKAWSSSSKGHHHSTTRSLGTTAADHLTVKSFLGRSVANGTNMKRLKKSKHWMTKQQLGKDVDADLNADIRRLSRRPGIDRTAATKTPFIEAAPNDRRENEAENRLFFTSFASHSLGRHHKSLRTCNKSADHCSTAGNIIVSPQLRTATAQH